MGCDIHAYIETSSEFKGKKTHYIWAHPHFNRSYWLFSMLAKVRGGALTDELGFEVKGIPDDISWETSTDYYFTVDDDRASEQGDDYEGRFCTQETADKYVSYGSKLVPSYTREDGYVMPAKIANPDWHSASWLTIDELEEVAKRWRTLPRYITTSDLSNVRIEEGVTIEQLQERIDTRKHKSKRFWKAEVLGIRDGWAMYRHTYKQRREGVSQDLLATIAAMKALRSKTCEPRLVFWFDN